MFFNILVLLTSVLCLVYCAPNCGENEVYIRCKSACKPRICEQNKVQQCDDTVKCQPGCECIDDFLRNNKNVCVPKEFCSTDYFKSIPIEYFDQVSGEEFILEDTNDDQTTGRNSNHSEESNTELVPNAYMAKASNKIAPNENSDIDYYYYEQQTEDEDLDFNRKYSKPLEQNKNKYLSSIDNNNAKMERSNNYIWSTPPFSKFTENEQATEETTEMQYIQMVEDNMERNLVSKLTTNQRQDEIATEQVQQVTATSKSKSKEIENKEWESKMPDSNSNLDNDQITNSPQPDDSIFDQHIEGTYQTVTESSATEDVSDIKSTSGRQPDDSRFDQHIEGTYQTVTESSAAEDVSDINETSDPQPDDPRFDQHIEGKYQFVTSSSAREDVSDINSTSRPQPDGSRFDQHIEGTYQTVTKSSATEDVSEGTEDETSGQSPGVWSESKYEKKTFNKTSDSKHIASERPNLWSETTPSFTYITVVPDNKDNSEFHQNNEDLHRKVTEETTDETQIFWFDESPSNRYYPNTTPKKSHDEKDSIIPVKIDQNNFIFNNWGALDPPPKWRGRYHESGRNEKKVDHRHEYGRRPIYKDEMRGHHTPEYERRPIYKDEMRGHHTPEYERRPIYNDKKRDPYNDGSSSFNHRPENRHRPINRRHSFKCTRRSGERTRCRVIRPKHWKPKYNKNHRSHVRPVHVCKRRHNGKLLCYWRRLYQKVRSHH